MLRAIAIVLISLVSFGLMTPVVSADTGAGLPLCCRAHGKHKCATRMAMDTSSGATIKSVSEKCPFALRLSTIALASSVFFPARLFVPCGALVSQPDRMAQTEARYRISFGRARQKRGPPALFA